MLVSLNEIENLTHKLLVKHGAEDWIASEVARAVKKAEAIGNKICGLFYVESYCTQLESGRVNGTVEPVISSPKSGVVQVDAKFGFAQPAFKRGLQDALSAARENGIAQLSICHSHTCTSLGFFTEQIAREGLIAIGLTNASPIVAPPGGKTRTIGTNPIAFSVPDGEGGLAMQFDQSTSAVALGKIKMAKAAGESIPEGWAIDADGNPTTNPEEALKGSLVSSGGYKGWGFGLMAEILAAGMTGGTFSKDVKPLLVPEGPPHDLGQFYILIDPSASSDFFTRVQTLAEAIAEDEGARMPGRNKVDSDPIEVADELWEKLSGMLE
jgi:(2R)-3-sulfolactate dehydrogenase (NADP+)